MKKYTEASEFNDKLKTNLRIALSLPFTGPIEGETWERLLANVLGAEQVQSKKLFDIVDNNGKGWSVKTRFGTTEKGIAVTPIIARARIFDLYDLDLDSDPQVIGESLVDFWNKKVNTHKKLQKVKNPYISILVKDVSLREFAYFEKEIDTYNPEDFVWEWGKPRKDLQPGLVGRPVNEDYWKFRWDPGGHQFFEKWLIPKDAYIFRLEVKIKTMEELKKALEI